MDAVMMEAEDGAGFAYRVSADGTISASDISGGRDGGTPVLMGETTSVWAAVLGDEDVYNHNARTPHAPARPRRPRCRSLTLVADGTMLEVVADGGVVITLDTRDVILPNPRRRGRGGGGGSSSRRAAPRLTFHRQLFKSQSLQQHMPCRQ